jgi:hypothetical protein|tara:strand:- start:398 stop:571 length:174 start_codon:yes stop_codon:yes gene_type:complete
MTETTKYAVQALWNNGFCQEIDRYDTIEEARVNQLRLGKRLGVVMVIHKTKSSSAPW